MHKLQEAYEGIGLKVYSAQSSSESISLSIDVWAKPGSKKKKIDWTGRGACGLCQCKAC